MEQFNKTFDDLKKGDSCWCLNTSGEAYQHFLYGDDLRKLRYGYAYLSEDEAIKEGKRNRIYRRLKEIANDRDVYYVCFRNNLFGRRLLLEVFVD